MTISSPGLIALLGSGETAPSAGVVYELLARRAPSPLRIAVLETPAGFQPNSVRVAGRVADFLQARLQNYGPEISILPARRRGTPESPDTPAVTEALRSVGLIFLGPGSPTYTVRQFHNSLAWHRLLARHRRGAAVVTASAATIALGVLVLPVYEIYKAGIDLHWQPGLNFFGPYGLSLVFVPHWNNSEGGAELDTNFCYMGRARWDEPLSLLPPQMTVVGIDEHTALVFDLDKATAQVLGRGAVTVVRDRQEQHFGRNDRFPLSLLGTFYLPDPSNGIPPSVWDEIPPDGEAPPAIQIPDDVLALLEARQQARAQHNWPAADMLRQQIAALGWQVRDTPDGPVTEPAGPGRL